MTRRGKTTYSLPDPPWKPDAVTFVPFKLSDDLSQWTDPTLERVWAGVMDRIARGLAVPAELLTGDPGATYASTATAMPAPGPSITEQVLQMRAMMRAFADKKATPPMTLPPLDPDEAALLRGVCAAPDDDLPRLVIADWYEEHGQAERARWVRACVADAPRTTPCQECQTARWAYRPTARIAWRHNPTCPIHRSLRAAVRRGERELMARYRLDFCPRWHWQVGAGDEWGWLPAVLDRVRDTGRIMLERGFPWCAAFDSWPAFDAAVAAGLWARVPVVRVEWPGLDDLPGHHRISLAFLIAVSADNPAGGRSRRRALSLWNRLPDMEGSRHSDNPDVRFPSAASLREHLSRACVDEGRAAAGLDPLAWPEWVEPAGAAVTDEAATLTPGQYAVPG